MRICFIVDSSSIHVQRIVSYFASRGDEIFVISTSVNKCNVLAEGGVFLLKDEEAPISNMYNTFIREKTLIRWWKSLVPEKTQFLINRTMRLVRLLSKRKFCKELIEKYDPDVIFCFRSFPEGVLASQCHIRPLVLRTAGSDICELPRFPGYKQVVRRVLQTVDLVVTESLWERELILRLCGREVRTEVNIIGVDTGLFRPILRKDDVRDRYCVPRDAFVAVSNRYLKGEYNGWLVVEAIESILEECPNLVLLYVNPWPMDSVTKAKAEALTARSPRIRIIDGPVAHCEIAQVLGCGDIYITFSSVDGIPNSLLEAMACGLVPIVGELPQLHEWIEQGVTGYIAAKDDAKGLATLVKAVYNNQEKLPDMSARCVYKVGEKGSYEICMDQQRKMLQDLIVLTIVEKLEKIGAR